MADDLTSMITDQLRDAYSAEKQALRAMARVLKKATSAALKAAIQAHIDQTEGQVARLDQALASIGAKAGRKVCEGMKGILEEGQSELADQEKGPTMDALIIAGLRRVEHYEMAAYGTTVALAQACGEKEVARLMAETLREETQTDADLGQLAEREVNPAMVAQARGTEAGATVPPANDRRPARRRSAA